MDQNGSYGQYCPLSKTAEILSNRWTMLLLRELLFSSSTFNDLSRGLPLMSRSLLASRLKRLVEIGILDHSEGAHSIHRQYKLTEAGRELEPVVVTMAKWGQKWLKTNPSIENVDVTLLMWNIRQNTNPLSVLPNPFTVCFYLTDVPENNSQHWLVYENNEVDLFYIDKNLKTDVSIEVSAKKLTKIWMGWDDFDEAIKSEELIIEGPRKYTKITKKWLGQNSLAHIKKVAPSKQINY